MATATAAINDESPLSRLPAELLRLVLSHLGPKPLLRFGAACRAAAVPLPPPPAEKVLLRCWDSSCISLELHNNAIAW